MKPGFSATLLAGAVLACLPAQTRTAGQTAPPAFRSGVELVEVPVLARDGKGHFVTDLTRDDFRILEEGVAQTLAFFERVTIPVVPPPALGPTTTPRDVATNDVAPDARLFVLVLDSQHTAAQRAPAVKKYARQFIERHVGPSDIVAVVSPGGLDSATQDFTSDKARLLAAIDQFSGTKLRSATIEREEERRMTAPIHQGRDPSDDERENRVQSLASVLEALATHLSGVERRRKSLLLFSEGIDYNTGDMAGSFTTRVQRHAPAVVEAMERGIAALVRASVAMYTIDPRGLGSGEGDLLELPIHEVPVASLDNPGLRGEYTNSIDSLRHLAEATGGFAAVDRNDFTGAFDRIVRESSDYYVLGYVPAKPAKPGEVRRIDVRVARPDVRVVARKAYATPKTVVRAPTAGAFGDASAMPDARNRGGRTRGIDTLSGSEPAPAATRGLPSELGALLASPLPRAGLPLRVHAVPYRGDGRKHVVALVIEVAGNALAFVERDQKFDERIRLALLTVDDRGRAGNGSSTTLDLRLTREELDRVKVTGVRWLSQLLLPPGRHQLRVAARAERTGTSGLATLDIDVPRFDRDRLSLSGIALTSLPAALMLTRGDSKVPSKLPGPPATSRTFVVGDRLTSVVEVYLPAAATADVDVSARVERRDGAAAGEAAQRGAQRVPRLPGKDRREEVAFAIDAGALAPGGYLLRIAAQQAGSAERVERTVPFEIIRK